MFATLLALTLAADPAAAPVKPITIGLLASTNKEAAHAQARALATFMRLATGRDAKTDIYADYEALSAALVQKEVDAALMPPLAFVRAEEKGKVEPLFKVVRNGQGTYRAVLFGLAGGQIKALDDLKKAKNLKVAWVDASSATGYIFPKALLVARKIDPAQVFVDQSFLGNHDAVCKAVEGGTAHLGATFTDDPASAKSPAITGCKSALGDKAGKLLVIAATDAIPNDALVVRADASADLKKRLTDAAAKADKRTLTEAFFADGTTAASADDYAPVRKALDTFKQ
jgi:phosphonate transport system substrate-binding protein